MEGAEIIMSITSHLRKLADDVEAGNVVARRLFYIVEQNGVNDLEIRYVGEPCDKAGVIGVFAAATSLCIKNLAGS
jgi:hypothetical protein